MQSSRRVETIWIAVQGVLHLQEMHCQLLINNQSPRYKIVPYGLLTAQ